MMKLLSASVAFAALVAGPAMAADLARPVYKAAPPPAAFSWTGIYVGVHAGSAWSVNDDTFTFNEGGGFVQQVTQQFNTTGFLGGAQVGFNYQTGPLVWGAEAQFSWSDITGSNLCFAEFQCRAKTDWLGTAAVRLGYAFDRTMIFVKGGGAWAHNKYDLSIIEGIGSQQNFNASETRWGWMFGTGIEHAFYGNWSAKVEYDFLDLGTKNVDFGLNALLSPGESVTTEIRQRIHLVKFGLNYRFGYTDGVVAKY
jgi:outer membrane immunogenic protein